MEMKKLFQKIIKSVFSKRKEKPFFEHSVKMSTRKFGAMRRRYKNTRPIAFVQDIYCHTELHEIWHSYYKEDKYGDEIKELEQIGLYDAKQGILYYEDELKKYIIDEYFDEEKTDY